MTNQLTIEQSIHVLPGEERGIPSVNDSGPSTAKRGLILISLLLIVCTAVGIGYWKYQKNSTKAGQAAVQKNLQITSAVPARTFAEPPPPPPLPAAAQSPSSGTVIVPAPIGAAESDVGGHGNPAQTLDKAGSSLMAVGGRPEKGASSASVGANANGGAEGSNAVQGINSEALGQPSGGMAEMLTGTTTPMRMAGMIGNQNFILAKGSFIDCALQTRLDSTIPGMTACVVTRNIYSDNGKVLLLERGSTASGEYKSNMRQGMARIGVVWTRIKTPNGVIINLDSGGTDQLGGAGVPGYIDEHFWKRFGGAIMISMIDDVARGISSNTGSGGNNQINFNGTGDAAQNMGVETLKNTINIPPTLYKNQGEQVGIYVARDLDFSSVYDVAAQ